MAERGLYGEWWLSGFMAVSSPRQPTPLSRVPPRLRSMADHSQAHRRVCDVSEPRAGAGPGLLGRLTKPLVFHPIHK